jgi:hypothetical protein
MFLKFCFNYEFFPAVIYFPLLHFTKMNNFYTAEGHEWELMGGDVAEGHEWELMGGDVAVGHEWELMGGDVAVGQWMKTDGWVATGYELELIGGLLLLMFIVTVNTFPR